MSAAQWVQAQKCSQGVGIADALVSVTTVEETWTTLVAASSGRACTFMGGFVTAVFRFVAASPVDPKVVCRLCSLVTQSMWAPLLVGNGLVLQQMTEAVLRDVDVGTEWAARWAHALAAMAVAHGTSRCPETLDALRRTVDALHGAVNTDVQAVMQLVRAAAAVGLPSCPTPGQNPRQKLVRDMDQVTRYLPSAQAVVSPDQAEAVLAVVPVVNAHFERLRASPAAHSALLNGVLCCDWLVLVFHCLHMAPCDTVPFAAAVHNLCGALQGGSSVRASALFPVTCRLSADTLCRVWQTESLPGPFMASVLALYVSTCPPCEDAVVAHEAVHVVAPVLWHRPEWSAGYGLGAWLRHVAAVMDRWQHGSLSPDLTLALAQEGLRTVAHAALILSTREADTVQCADVQCADTLLVDACRSIVWVLQHGNAAQKAQCARSCPAALVLAYGPRQLPPTAASWVLVMWDSAAGFRRCQRNQDPAAEEGLAAAHKQCLVWRHSLQGTAPG